MKNKTKYLAIGALVLLVATFLFSFSGNKTSGGEFSSNGGENENASFSEKITSFFTASIPKELGPAEYTSWCENSENGLVANKVIGEFEYTAFYKHANYIALKEYSSPAGINADSLQKKINDLGDMEYFNFRIRSLTESTELLKVNLADEGEYFNRIEYFSFKMQDDFQLVEGTDTLKCQLYHFERVYGLSNSATVILGFEKRKHKGSLSLYFNDKVFNNGNIILNISKNSINNTPKLNLNL